MWLAMTGRSLMCVLLLGAACAARAEERGPVRVTRSTGEASLKPLLGAEGAFLYADAARVGGPELAQLRRAYLAGKIIVLDGLQASDARVRETSMIIGGIGLVAPVLVLAHRHGADGTPAIFALHLQDTIVRGSAVPGPALDDLATQVRDILAESVLRRPPRAVPESMQFKPEYTYTVHHRLNRVSCPLYMQLSNGRFYGSKNDLCVALGRIHLAYKVDLLRSVPVRDGRMLTEDMKYVRISVLPTLGGTGIRLANTLNEEDVWKESWTHRNVFFGPFVDRYSFMVVPVGDPDVHLIGHEPPSTNPDMNITVSSGIDIGMSASIKGSVSEKGLSGEAGVSGNIGYRSQRTVVQNTHEYTIENNSGRVANAAAWDWDRKYEEKKCDWLNSGYGNCYFDSLAWWYGPVFNKSRFSAMSHKNFVPGFSATYRVPASRQGKTRFRLQADVNVMGLGAKVMPIIVAVRSELKDKTSHMILSATEFEVDWSGIYFEPEPTVQLQSMASDSLCLSVEGASAVAGMPVVAATCTGGRWQQWGLDRHERYRSRIHPDRCLSVSAQTQALTIDACDDNLARKWSWDGDALKTRLPMPGQQQWLSLEHGRLVMAAKNARTDWRSYMVRLD